MHGIDRWALNILILVVTQTAAIAYLDVASRIIFHSTKNVTLSNSSKQTQKSDSWASEAISIAMKNIINRSIDFNLFPSSDHFYPTPDLSCLDWIPAQYITFLQLPLRIISWTELASPNAMICDQSVLSFAILTFSHVYTDEIQNKQIWLPSVRLEHLLCIFL